MSNELTRIRNQLLQRPFCRTFICLIRREELEEGILPKWFTKSVNWAISE